MFMREIIICLQERFMLAMKVMLIVDVVSTWILC